ncbi:MAG: ABC transporter permease [Planctomycetota bacterium]
MRALAIAQRETASMFRLPVGWVVIALYLFLAAVVFVVGTFRPGSAATLRDFFSLSQWLLVPIAPAISMRLISEEIRTGSIEPLMTSPASEASIIVGKFLGALAYLVAMLAPTLAFPVLLWMHAEPAPDIGPIASGYLALLLLGCTFLSLGLVASAVTSSQTLAFLATLFVLIGWVMLPTLAIPGLPGWAAEAIASVAVGPRVGELAKGVIDARAVAFFIAATLVFLAAAWSALRLRRWA